MTTGLIRFRRDLRRHDHTAPYHALHRHERVHAAFVFDCGILGVLPDRREGERRFARRLPELAAQQEQTGVAIGRDYPPPIVDHSRACQDALELYRKAARS